MLHSISIVLKVAVVRRTSEYLVP